MLNQDQNTQYIAGLSPWKLSSTPGTLVMGILRMCSYVNEYFAIDRIPSVTDSSLFFLSDLLGISKSNQSPKSHLNNAIGVRRTLKGRLIILGSIICSKHNHRGSN